MTLTKSDAELLREAAASCETANVIAKLNDRADELDPTVSEPAKAVGKVLQASMRFTPNWRRVESDVELACDIAAAAREGMVDTGAVFDALSEEHLRNWADMALTPEFKAGWEAAVSSLKKELSL